MNLDIGDLVNIDFATVARAIEETSAKEIYEGKIVAIEEDANDPNNDIYIVAIKLPELAFYGDELTALPRRVRKQTL